MSWLAVDKGGCEHIFAEKPCRNESNTLWICSVLYLYGLMYKTDCGTYQEMWELEVKAYYLDGWIYADELFDLIIKGGDSK